jgi:hypothetical protein
MRNRSELLGEVREAIPMKLVLIGILSLVMPA